MMIEAAPFDELGEVAIGRTKDMHSDKCLVRLWREGGEFLEGVWGEMTQQSRGSGRCGLGVD